MFGLLDLVTKRVTDQLTEYAVARSDIVRRLWGNWLAPFQACQPVKIRASRRIRNTATIREAARHR